MQWRGVRRLSVCPSVNFCANRFFSQANGRIATKLAHDGLQVSVHPRYAQGQGQGQRSRDTRTFLDSWNELLRHWRSGFVWSVSTSVWFKWSKHALNPWISIVKATKKHKNRFKTREKQNAKHVFCIPRSWACLASGLMNRSYYRDVIALVTSWLYVTPSDT